MSFGSIGSVTDMEGLAAPNPQGAWRSGNRFPLLHAPEGSYLNSENCATNTNSALVQNIGQSNSSPSGSPVCGQGGGRVG